MEPFLGEIRTFPWNFAPRGWALCNGALLPINQYQALYSLLGTNYGGNGQTNFGLPDLQGRVPISVGTAAGQSYAQGQKGGSETVQLSVSTMPAHNHAMNALGATPGDIVNPVGLSSTVGAGAPGVTINIYAPAGAGTTVTLANDTISSNGGGGAHNNVQPFLVLNFCIALQGVFPSRS